jgi:hypothetical protein
MGQTIGTHLAQTCYEVLKACFKARFCQKKKQWPTAFAACLLLLGSFLAPSFHNCCCCLHHSQFLITTRSGHHYRKLPRASPWLPILAIPIRERIWSPVSSAARSAAGRLPTAISLFSFVKTRAVASFLYQKIEEGKKINSTILQILSIYLNRNTSCLNFVNHASLV